MAKEIRMLLERKLEKTEMTPTLVSLFWAIKPFVPYNEVKELADRILKAIAEDKNVICEDKARALVMLKFVQRGDRDMTKAIQKKIDLIQQKDPVIFKKLLPQRVPGSMLPTAKRGNARRAK